LAGDVYLPPSMLDYPSETDDSQKINHPALTARQMQVVREMAKGQSNRQIGEALQVTEGTVKLHIASIFRLLKVNNRTEAVLVIQKMSLQKGRK
jgi:DNA-binding NarL/FixJ family response regulator